MIENGDGPNNHLLFKFDELPAPLYGIILHKFVWGKLCIIWHPITAANIINTAQGHNTDT